jgi:hypothetical protein
MPLRKCGTRCAHRKTLAPRIASEYAIATSNLIQPAATRLAVRGLSVKFNKRVLRGFPLTNSSTIIVERFEWIIALAPQLVALASQACVFIDKLVHRVARFTQRRLPAGRMAKLRVGNNRRRPLASLSSIRCSLRQYNPALFLRLELLNFGPQLLDLVAPFLAHGRVRLGNFITQLLELGIEIIVEAALKPRIPLLGGVVHFLIARSIVAIHSGATS